MKKNPYNCVKPGNLFVGYDRLRRDMLRGLENGHSYALLGGRRCGKTSFLYRMRDDLNETVASRYRFLPRFISIQSFNSLTTNILFKRIYELASDGIETPEWEKDDEGEDYQNFLNHIHKISACLVGKYGRRWCIVLLVDELDGALRHLVYDTFYQNLRNMLMESDFNSNFRLIATGVTEMDNLITSGGSPLNNLSSKYLGILSKKDAHNLVAAGFGDTPRKSSINEIFKLTGKHPYLLQAILEKLYEENSALDQEALKNAAGVFLKDRHDFSRWMEAFGKHGREVYRALMENEGLSWNSIVKKICSSVPGMSRGGASEALTVLSYHGVVDDTDEARPLVAGAMFRDWFRERMTITFNEKKIDYDVFLSYNSKDDEMVMSIKTLLEGYGIKPWIDKEGISAGDNWLDKLEEILKKVGSAAIFLGPHGVGKWMHTEIQILVQRHKEGDLKIIPVILAGCSGEVKMPLFIQNYHCIDLGQVETNPFQALVHAIRPNHGKKIGH